MLIAARPPLRRSNEAANFATTCGVMMPGWTATISSILLVSGVLFMIAGLKDFRPSIFGKANTFAQVAAIFFAMLLLVMPVLWVDIARKTFLRATFIFTIISAVHYAFLVQHRLRNHAQSREVATDSV